MQGLVNVQQLEICSLPQSLLMLTDSFLLSHGIRCRSKSPMRFFAAQGHVGIV